MNTDDTFKNTEDNNHADAGLTPELEVRVVAWVLGEATPAEAAELARRVAENPALADFKRRIEAVHGLVGAAARPMNDATLRLSDERRAKVLAVIGEDAPEASEERADARGSSTPRWVLAWNKWALPMAACITLCTLLGAVLMPSFQKGRKPKRPDPSFTVLGPSGSALMQSDALTPTEVVVNSLERDAPMVAFKSATSRITAAEFADTGTRSTMSPAAPLASPKPVGSDLLDTGNARGGSVAGVYSASSLATDAAQPTDKFDGGQLNAVGGKDTGSVGVVRGPLMPVFGFREIKREDQSAHKKLAPPEGTPQEFKRHELADADSQTLQNNETRPAADYFAAPSQASPSLSDNVMSSDEKNQRQLVAKGRSQYLAGDMDGALATFRGAEAINPESQEAKFFLSRISKEKAQLGVLNRAKTQAQMVQEVASAWQRPGVYMNGQTTAEPTADSQALLKKMEGIQIPSVNFQGVELSKVVSTLTTLSEDADTTNDQAKGVSVILIDPTNANPTVSLTLRNLSLKRTLDFITDATGYKYEIHGDAVVISPGDATTGTGIDTVAIPIKEALLKRIIGAGIPVGKEMEAIRGYFQQAGVNSEGSGIGYAYDGTSLIVTNTERNIQRVRSIVKRYEEQEVKKVPGFDESLRLETATNQQAVSTFSLHVSDASFRIAKAALARGEAPDPTSIRPEEFYNAFDYGDPSAVAGEPVACRIEQSAHPFLQQRNLVRIAMKVPATGRGNGQPLRLTVLLDTSGSMEREDRAAGVRAALTSLVSLLGSDDRITLIGFARQPHLLADRVPGNQAAGLADLVAKTPFEGGTNLEEALKLAGNLARGQFIASAQNRIVLLTDGAANLGNDDPAQLATMIAALRQQGIAFDACGVGADGLDDTLLEALTRKGDGRYAVINSPEEADAGFARKLAGAFRPAAENVKVQVRFNPSRVAHYRLIGFEQHRLKTEDFRNDRVDAAELAAEEAAVALYQVEVLPDGEGELGEVFVRFRDVATGSMVERSWTLSYVPQPPAFARATPSMRLAGIAAFLAEKLRGGDLAAQIRLDELAPVVNTLRGDYAHDTRVRDFVTMFAQARRMTGE